MFQQLDITPASTLAQSPVTLTPWFERWMRLFDMVWAEGDPITIVTRVGGRDT